MVDLVQAVGQPPTRRRQLLAHERVSATGQWDVSRAARTACRMRISPPRITSSFTRAVANATKRARRTARPGSLLTIPVAVALCHKVT